jgi:DNA-binding transcriptional MerR regulator
MTEPWLKINELAPKLGVSVRTLQRLKPPRIKVGGQYRYLYSEVEAFFRQQNGRLR